MGHLGDVVGRARATVRCEKTKTNMFFRHFLSSKKIEGSARERRLHAVWLVAVQAQLGEVSKEKLVAELQDMVSQDVQLDPRTQLAMLSPLIGPRD